MAGLGSLLGPAAPAPGTPQGDLGKPLPGAGGAGVPGAAHFGTPLTLRGTAHGQGRGGRKKGLVLSARNGAGAGARAGGGQWEGGEEGFLMQSGRSGRSGGGGAFGGGFKAGAVAWAAAGGGGGVGRPEASLEAEAAAGDGSSNGRLPTNPNPTSNPNPNGRVQGLSGVLTEPQGGLGLGGGATPPPTSSIPHSIGEEEEVGGGITGDYSEDEELRSVVQDIAAIEIQSSSVAEQVTAHARTLAEASRKLRARAQATRLEAAKLKKVARLFQAQEFRQREELRASRMKGQEDARRQQAEAQEAQEQVRALQQQLLLQQLQLDQQENQISQQQQQLLQQQEEQENQEKLLQQQQKELERERQEMAAAAAATAAPAPAAPEAAVGGQPQLAAPPAPAQANVYFSDQRDDSSRCRGSPESQGAPGAPPGGPVGGPLGAAVLPFAFPDGKHFGKGLDSAVASGPAVEGGRERAPHTVNPVAPPPPPAVPAAQAPRAGAGAGAGTGVGGQSQNGSPAAVAGAGAAGDSLAASDSLAGVDSLADASSVHLSSDGSLVVSETMECEIAHPGAMACTKTVVKKDNTNKVAVVSMETTVRCTGDGCLVGSVNVDDFAALAMASLSDTAIELKHSPKFQGVDSDPRVASRRTDIVEMLAEGEVVECRAMEPPSKFGHESFIVQLRNRHTGQQIKGMFKPRVEGDAEGWHRAPVEWVAYELNLLLGMDYIPPVAYRTGGVDLGNNKKYDEGAFLYWVPAAKELREVHASNWGVSVARLLSDTRILDILLNNSDRHHGHFLFGEHWADGRKRVVLIDHAAGFRKEASVLMEHENAFQTGPVRCVSAHTYMRLRFLDRAMVEDKFQGVLTPQEIDGLLYRKDKVLEYLDHLVQERGYHRTVVE